MQNQENTNSPTPSIYKYSPNEFKPRLQPHTTATGPEVGPGKYDEKRTNFPKTNKYGELLMQDWKKYKPQFTFKSNSPRISPFMLSEAPLPGKYESASFTNEIIKRNAKLKPLKLCKSKKSKSNSKIPGPSDYKVSEALKFLEQSPFKNRRTNAIFVSKTQRNAEKSTYYIGMETPAVGNYEETNRTIETELLNQLKKMHSTKASQKNLPSLGFNSRVSRFDDKKGNDLGPGKYLTEIDNRMRKTNIALAKCDRFLDLSEIRKYPGPGSYQYCDDWYKPGFSLLNPKF